MTDSLERKILADNIPFDELRQIESDYSQGKCARLASAMERYVVVRRPEIFLLYKKLRFASTEMTLDSAICTFILSSNTLTPNEDFEDQREEISREFWYSGEKGQYDHAKIASDWIATYAAGWRQHRMRTLLYVYQKNREKYLELIGPTPSSQTLGAVSLTQCGSSVSQSTSSNQTQSVPSPPTQPSVGGLPRSGHVSE